MSDVTRLIDAAAAGDARAAADLLPLVYDELRRLAAARLAGERPGQTLEATALVHEAYLRLIGSEAAPGNSNRRRTDFQPDAYALHYSGGLSLSRSLPAAVHPHAGQPCEAD